MRDIERVLMRRDGLTADEAREQVEEMHQDILNGADPEELLYDIGLEPDYIFDILY